jgi:uncharacterized cupredoxin-like copper-binding protein
MKRTVTFGVIAALVAVFVSGAAAAPKAQKLTITMAEFKYSPKTITIRAGVPVELTVVNRGAVEHEFLVYTPPKTAPDDWDEYAIANTYFQDLGEVEVVFRDRGAVAGTSLFEVELEKGRSATVLFTPAKKGTFEIGCHVEGHYEAGMKGTLIVK